MGGEEACERREVYSLVTSRVVDAPRAHPRARGSRAAGYGLRFDVTRRAPPPAARPYSVSLARARTIVWLDLAAVAVRGACSWSCCFRSRTGASA